MVTYNGASDPVGSGPRWAIGLAEPADYFSAELHEEKSQEDEVPKLSQYSKPVEAGYLVSDDWFTPLGSGPLKTNRSEDHISSAAALTLGGGINLYLAMALGHDGTTDQGCVELLGTAGKWLKQRREYLEGTTNFCDVGIVLGTADAKDLVWPGGPLNYGQEVAALETSLRQAGYLPCRLVNCPHQQRWDEIPVGIRTLILPDRVNLTSAEREKVRSFLKRGGKVLAFGRGAGLARSGDDPKVDEAFGVVGAGYLEPVDFEGITLEWRGKRASLKPPVILARPKSAKVLEWGRVETEGLVPLLASNRVGDGTAYFATVTESAFSESPEILEELWKETIGEPAWTIAEDPGRYFVFVRKQAGRLILHIVDDLSWHASANTRYHPQYIHLRLNAGVVPFQKVTVVPENQSIPVSTDGAWEVLELYPNVEMMLLLEA